MFSSSDIAWSIVIPALIALAIGLACWRPWRRGLARAWGAPLAMGVAFLIAFPMIQTGGTWHWPLVGPKESADWLPWIALLAMLLGLFSIIIHAPRWVWVILLLLAGAAMYAGMLKFKFARDWSPVQGGFILLGLAFVGVIWWAILEAFGEQEPISASIIHWLTASCAAVILMLTGSQIYGTFSLPLAAVAGAMLVLSIWRRQKIRLNGLPMVFSMTLIAILGGGFYLSNLSLPAMLLVFCAPVLAGASYLLPARMRFWQRMVLRVILAAIPLAAAASIAAVQFAHEQQGAGVLDEQ